MVEIIDINGVRTLMKDGACLCCEHPENVKLYEEAASSCSGSVLVMGLGLGMIARALRVNPAVERVVVVEVDAEVVDLVGPMDGVELVLADALVYEPGKRVDVCYWDIESEWEGSTVIDHHSRCDRSLAFADRAFGLIDTWLDRGLSIG